MAYLSRGHPPLLPLETQGTPSEPSLSPSCDSRQLTADSRQPTAVYIYTRAACGRGPARGAGRIKAGVGAEAGGGGGGGKSPSLLGKRVPAS
eukprot:scaffold354_cov234-Pinguiococcus_pyrenoidosus.AAC.5